MVQIEEVEEVDGIVIEDVTNTEHEGHGHEHAVHGHTGHEHHAHHCAGHTKRLPVIVLTGYLGAGKTTLLNYILTTQTDKKLAVIENEIGEVSIDDVLVEQRHQDMAEELVVLENGCVCCTIRGDLVRTLYGIAARCADGLALDGVLIELTGMADPAPVVQTFYMDHEVSHHFYIDNVVALVDAKHALEKLDESRHDPDEKGTASAQIAFSSCVLLNKIDLVEPAHLESVERRIKSVNSTVEIIRCERACVPMAKLFSVGIFDLSRVLEEQYMDEQEFTTFYRPKMDQSVSNVGVRCEGAVCKFAFERFLHSLLGEEETAKDFLRIKGVLNIAGLDDKFVLQCVQMLRSWAPQEPWGPAETRENRIIFIGRGMQRRRQELETGFRACLARPLRFAVGAEVEARTGPDEDDYEPGLVEAHWHECNAYRVLLLGGSGLVHAPMDDDRFIRAGSPGTCTDMDVE